MQQHIVPASAITGAITLPGDKSISHRYAMISAIADGESRIQNYSTGADCHSTLGCVRALGIDVEVDGTNVRIDGKGLDGLRAPAADLDAGNSGSTIRMLSRNSGRPALRHADLRGRVALPPADAAHHAAAGRNGRGDPRARRQISSARNPRHPAAAHRLHAARAQRAGEDLRAVCRTLRRGPDHGHRGGRVARSQ